MNATGRETTLAQERLHWGIFMIPALAVVALLIIILPVLMLTHSMSNIFQPLNPQASSPIGGLFLFFFIGPEALLVVVLLLFTWVAYLKSNITLTDRRLVFRTGLFARVTGELPLQNVEAIILSESVLGRLLGHGSVEVTSVGGFRFPLRYIAAPQKFHALLQQTVAAAKSSVKSPNPISPQPPDTDDSRYMPKK